MRRRHRPHEADVDVPASDEEVVAVVRAHWWGLVGPCAVVVVALAATLALLGADPPEAASLAAVAVLVAAAVRLLVRYARWGARRLVVTSQRVVVRRGVLDRRTQEVPLAVVTGVAVRQSLRQRLLRSGDLELSVAGGGGPLVVPDVPAVRAVAADVGRLGRGGSGWPPPVAAADATTVWPG